MLFTNLKMQRLRKCTTSNVWLKVTKGASIATIRSIIKKVLVNQQLGGVINDAGSSLSEDYIDIGNKNLKRLEFKITDERGTVMNLYGIPVQFALLLSNPSAY